MPPESTENCWGSILNSGAYGEITGYRIGEFTIDLDRGGLFRGGAEVRIRPRSFDVLRYLAERPGKLVSRDELMDALWEGAVVTEDAVTQCFIDIRRALGDESQTMVRTVPRRGYILELPVEALGPASREEDEQPAGNASNRRFLGAAAIMVILAVAAVAMYASRDDTAPTPDSTTEIVATLSPSIAVLPFANMGPDPGQSYFADGVSEEIINSLARQRGLKVIARTSSFSFRDQNVDVATIAERLDVSHVLEGSVRNDGDALRINVQLVDAGTGEYVWNEQFDRALSAASVFAIQSEIATAVVESLQSELTAEERARLVRVPTEDLQALEAYFQARQLLEVRRAPELDRAADLLREAIDRDPQFALAYVSLAETLRLQWGYGTLPRPVADEQMAAAIEAALEIDDRLGQAYASLGNLRATLGDGHGAEEAYLRGIELSPSYAPLYQWYGEFLNFWGRPQEGLPYSRISVALDPRSAIINADYAETLAGAGYTDDALARYDQILAEDPDFTPALEGKGAVLRLFLGRAAEAIPVLERARALSPESPAMVVPLANAYIDIGELDRAADLLDEVKAAAPGHTLPAMAAIGLHLLQGSPNETRQAAEFVVRTWGGFPPAMRALRDLDLEAEDIDAALARYERVFPALFEEIVPELGTVNAHAAIDLAYLFKRTGRSERADELIDRALAYVNDQAVIGWSGVGIYKVRAHAILGNYDAALDLLQEAVDQGWRAHWQAELEHDLALAELRALPRYEEIVSIIRADMAAQREELENSRSP